MSFLAVVVILAVFSIGGSYVGDPTFRADQDPGHWRTTASAEDQ